MSSDERPGIGREGLAWTLARLTLVVAGILALLLFVWAAREAFLLAFAAILVALLLLAAAAPIERWTGISRSWSLGSVGILLVLAIAGFAWLLGGPVRAQVANLSEQLPEALDTVQESLGLRLTADELMQGDGGVGLSGIAAAGQQLLGSLFSFGSTVVTALSGLIVVVIGAFFLAADPASYRRGLVKLFPPRHHARAQDALLAAGRALELWLVAQLLAMAIVGVLIGLGAWAVGLSAPLALGLFAAITEFIPLLGPWIGALPAVLLALSHDAGTLLWTASLYLAVQQLESNVIIPKLQQHMMDVPPALMLFAVIAVGLVFGMLGVLIAAPLTVVAFVLVKKLYVRETLGEATTVPGEQ